MPIRRVISNNLNIKIAALIMAVVIWVFAKGEQTADRLLSIPLVLRNVPSGVTTVERPPAAIDVVFTGANKDLLKLQFTGQPYAVIDMTSAAEGRVFRVGLSAANVILPRDTEVQVAEIRDPKSLDLEIDALATRRLPVTPNVLGNLAPGYFAVGQATSVPDSVSVHGPASVVRTLAGVGTAPLDITGRRNRVEATRRVAFPDNWNLHSVPRDVQVRLEVEGTKVVTLTDVPVRLRHEPGFASVSIEPKALAIDISGPEHIVAGIQSSDVKVLVDARGLPRGVHQLVPEIDVPAGVEIASIRPTRFTVTLE